MSFFGWLFGLFRRKPQQPVLGEHDAYERCHGTRAGEVRVVPVTPPKPRLLPRLSGDHLRRCFQERLDNRRTAHP
jgi:hypothetical protein